MRQALYNFYIDADNVNKENGPPKLEKDNSIMHCSVSLISTMHQATYFYAKRDKNTKVVEWLS